MKYLTEKDRYVAPLAGAWIEIEMTVGSDGKPVSLPSRERGLKSGFIVQGMIQPESLPSRERGLKLLCY